MGRSELKFLLWDVDGVFVDTEELKFESWRLLLEQFGKTFTPEEYTHFIGRGSKENTEDICTKRGIPGSWQALTETRRGYYAQLRSKGVEVFQNNVALVHQFKEQFPTFVHAVVSSALRKDIRENLHTSGFSEDFFAAIVSYEEKPGMKRKPAPDMYVYAVEKLGAQPAGCVAFEDSAAGVEAVRAAGIFCVALPNKLTQQQNLSAANLLIGRQERRDASEIVRAFREW